SVAARIVRLLSRVLSGDPEGNSTGRDRSSREATGGARDGDSIEHNQILETVLRESGSRVCIFVRGIGEKSANVAGSLGWHVDSRCRTGCGSAPSWNGVYNRARVASSRGTDLRSARGYDCNHRYKSRDSIGFRSVGYRRNREVDG